MNGFKMPLFSGSNMIHLADNDFMLKAFGDYTAAKARRVTSVLQVVSEVTDFLIQNDEMPPDAQIEEMIGNATLDPYAWILTDSGYVRLFDLVKGVAQDEGTVVTYAFNGDALNQSLADDIISSISEDLVNLTALSATIDAQITGGSISDILNVFDNVGGTILQSVVAKGSSIVAFYKELIRKRLTNESFASQLLTSFSLDEIMDEPNWFEPTKAPIGSYTGSSPIGPLDFDNALGAVTDVAKKGLKVAAALLKGVANTVASAFTRVSKYVTTTCIDPNDILLYDDIGDGVCEGFAHQYALTHQYMSIGLPPEAFGENAADDFVAQWNSTKEGLQILIDALLEQNKLLVYKSLFGIFVYQDVHVQLGSITKSDNEHVTIRLDFTGSGKALFYPRLFDVDKLKLLMQGFQWYSDDSFKVTSDQFGQLKEAILRSGSINKVPGEFAESKLYQSLAFAVSTLGGEDHYYLGQMHPYVCDDIYYMDPEVSQKISFRMTIPDVSSVNNRMFVKVCSGLYPDQDPSEMRRAPSGMYSVVTSLIFHLFEAISYPTDYGFLPYSSKVEDTPIAGFRIKTDEENAQAFNNFGVNLVVGTVAVAAVVLVGTATWSLSRALFKRRQRIIQTVNRKLANNQSVSPMEWRRYRRATLNSPATRAISEATTESQSIGLDNVQSSMVDLRQLIRNEL